MSEWERETRRAHSISRRRQYFMSSDTLGFRFLPIQLDVTGKLLVTIIWMDHYNQWWHRVFSNQATIQARGEWESAEISKRVGGSEWNDNIFSLTTCATHATTLLPLNISLSLSAHTIIYAPSWLISLAWVPHELTFHCLILYGHELSVVKGIHRKDSLYSVFQESYISFSVGVSATTLALNKSYKTLSTVKGKIGWKIFNKTMP